MAVPHPASAALDTAAGIAHAVASGRLPPTAPLSEHVARHRATHAALNALVQPRHAAAREDAERLASAVRGATPLALAGVPVSVKECFGVAGLVTTLGIPARRQMVDTADASLVARLREAGAIVVGKANVPQAMYLHETDNPVWGRTSHPLDPARGPGGSSGGDAALVAAGVVPLAVGTDLAGSIRQPAHACGISGLLPRTATLGDGGAFDTVPNLVGVRPRAGFLARTVDDLALALDAVVGGVPAAAQLVGAPAALRVGTWDETGPLEPSPAVRRAVAEATAALARAGATVERLDGGLAEEAAWLLLGLLSADGGADIRRLFGGSQPMPPVRRLLRLAGLPGWGRPGLAAAARLGGRRIEARALLATGPRRGVALSRLLDRIAAFADRFTAATAGLDVLVCPVSAVPALPHGMASKLVVAAAPCLLANLLDLAAGVVPVTSVRPAEQSGRRWSRDPVVRAAIATDRESAGLPVGVQVIGLPPPTSSVVTCHAEAIVLGTMRLLEGAVGRAGAATEKVG